MNDRHPSAGPAQSVPAPDAPYGHGQYAAYEQPYAPQGYAGYGDHASGHWDTSTTSQWGAGGHTQTWDFSGYDLGHDSTGQYAAQQWDTSGGSGQWDLSGTAAASAHPSGQWDTGAWSAAGSAAGTYDTGQHHSGEWGQWDATGQNQYFTQPAQSQPVQPVQAWDASGQSWDTSGQWDSGQWDMSAPATQTWDASAYATADAPQAQDRLHSEQQQPEVQHTPTVMVDVSGVPGLSEAAGVADAETRAMVITPLPEETEGIGNAGATGDDDPAPAPSRARSRAEVPHQSRGSRRKGAPARAGYRPRRKALLTVAVPSVAVMGVAGIAAASVMTGGGQKDTQQTTAASAPDNSVKLSAANSKLDTQLASLSQGADDFASRASRTQERIDLKVRQEEERKRKAEEAARKERERPKFALPVDQHGLSAYYGQAGVNWMSVHTGIDFPVSYGTPVMAANDGTVSTQYNVAYGNMAKVTSSDGTETWYCHLSSYKLRSGPVKAGDVIAYSGNSGNSTGPHLHFEVHPGGSAVDPLPWLRSHDLDPT
ncbi:peptidoglycan DD-metalloendopeptidase family protein [Streptomyces sp. UNOB3_S3]|uniref:M23 family metallopeptidase n=1 Tax=Streptomyces sp. UNOB3_S3 TaxID=2871682 RepID=UPI001E5F861B|nr:peptidoglycan DD-metalloendopeptidase family protein [Streptomyces sp. UNOB3_S3]MCC3777905.1 peptidoglycan DD-metalloendopeptidase family protein [Streptomyces sp. UNOB3_S3]